MQGAPEPPARRVLRIGFGVLWLLDGALQIQSHMPLGLPENVVAPSAQGSPAWLVSAVHWGLRVWENHPVQAAVAAVWIQLGLGLWLLLVVRGRWSRIGGAVSVGWALSVWVFGESMGGTLAPGASWMFGAPGAALFYALAGALLALPERAWRDPRLGRRLLAGFGVYFVAMAVLQAWPGNGFWTAGSSGALTAMAAEMSETPQPHAIAQVVGHFGGFAAEHAVLVNAFVVAALGAIGLAPAQRPPPRGAGGGGGGARGVPRRLGAGAGLRGVRRRRHRPQQHDPHAARAVGLLPRARAPRARHSTRARSGRACPPAPQAAAGPSEPATGGRGARRRGGLRHHRAGRRAVRDRRRRAQRDDAAGGKHRRPRHGGGRETCDPPTCRWSNSTAGHHLRKLHGKVLLVTYLDPVCTTDCPVIAQEFKQADACSAAKRATWISWRSTPTRSTAPPPTCARSTARSTSNSCPTGSTSPGSVGELRKLWSAFGVEIWVPRGGAMVTHPDGAAVIDREGRVRWLANFDPGPETASTKSSFAVTLAQAARQALNEA